MSRVGKKPIELGKDLSAEVKGRSVTIKGKKGSLTLETNSEVEVTVEGNLVKVAPRSGSNFANAMSGTTRAHLANMVAGVTKGFEKKLELVGVGYRAAVQGKKLNLTLGFSHPVEFPIPDGHHDRNAEPERDHREGHGPAAGRPGGGRVAPLPSAGAVQGQGRQVLERANRDQGSEEEVAMAIDKKQKRQRRARRTRVRISLLGVHRLCVHRTPQHIYAQIIAPEGNRVVASASTLNKELRGSLKGTGNIAAAAAVGKEIAARAKKAGVEKVAFDRSGFKYHGRVKALADAAREAGLNV